MDTQVRETGDITQHIGAYELHAAYEGKERRATIIDTPGHEAFSHIREHGLDLADIALLVVSSEEGWRRQTGEAHAIIGEKNMPYIVVFTKIDTEKSDTERAKRSVMEQGVPLEGYGGSVPWVAVSSVTNEHIADLIELIFLTADVYDITEDDGNAGAGLLVEADIDPKTGIAGTVIVLKGTLESSKYIRAGGSVAPLRIMKNDRGGDVQSAVPSAPVRVIGFDTIPPTGEPVFIHDTKKEAADAAKKERSEAGAREMPDNGGRTIPLVLRSDTASGLSSIEYAVKKMAVDGVSFAIIKQGVGDVTEEDVRLAAAQDDGHVIGFHTGADRRAQHLAERNGTTIRLFPTIYELIDWVTAISEKKKDAYETEHPTGSAVIIRIFDENSTRGTHIVGAQMRDGSFTVGQNIMIRRNGANAGRFVIESIEQRNRKQESVSGEKTQFAMSIRGGEPVALQDTALALPDVPEE